MPSIVSLIKDSQKLTSIFGAWPSFHDAEIIEFHFRRADVQPDAWDDSPFPQLTAKLRVLEATQPKARHAGNDFLVTLRFQCICDFRMERFDTNNQIVDLSISTECVSPYGECLPSYFVVQFVSGGGSLTASFRCVEIEVVEVIEAIPYPDV
jgi:hypothetical protein